MERDLLLVIDMQNVYDQGGQWECPNTRRAARNIEKLLRMKRFTPVKHNEWKNCDFVHEEESVIFTNFLASEHPEGVWNEYNRENAEVNGDEHANAMIEGLYTEAYPLYTKSTYSSLEIPEVREAARRSGRVVITGVVAECCVLATTMALIDQGTYVLYLTDAVAGIDDQTESAVETILSGLEPLHVKRMTTEEYLAEEKVFERP